jgi:UDP-glucose 4-epimerase
LESEASVTPSSVLITGGFGYLGGRIAQRLAEIPEMSLRVATRQAGIRQPSWLPRGEIISLDVGSDMSVASACRNVDTIVHLAAMNEIDCAENPGTAIEVNVGGTLRLVQGAKRAGVRKFIYMSTAHVYGAPLAGTITEMTLPRPIHPYAITHRAAEDFVLAGGRNDALCGVVIRLSNGIGAPAHSGINRWSLVGNDLCRQAVETGQMVLKSAGLQRRDFVPVADVCDAIAYLIALDASRISDGIVNLGGGLPLRIIDLAERIAARCEALLGFRPPIVRPEPTTGDQSMDLDYRSERLRDTGFTPAGDLDREIDRTITLCASAFRKTT